MAKMMTDQGKCRDYCCPGHNPKELDHGVERAREKREWTREAKQAATEAVHPAQPTPAQLPPTRSLP